MLLNGNSVSKIIQLGIEDEEKLEKNIVWIFGYDKTRIENLGELLSSQAYFMNEPKVIPHIDFSRWGNNTATSFLNSMQKKGKNPKYDYFFFRGFQQTWKVYLRKLILNRIYAQFHDLDKKSVITESGGSVGAEIILDVLPNSKMIILFEDGMKEVIKKIDSHQMSSNPRSGLPVWVSLNNRKSLIEYRAKMWDFHTKCLINAFEGHNSELCMMIKYEEIKQNTLDVIQKISNFLKVELDKTYVQNFIDKNNSYDQYSTNEKLSSTNYDKEETVMIKNIIEKTMIKLGYSINL